MAKRPDGMNTPPSRDSSFWAGFRNADAAGIDHIHAELNRSPIITVDGKDKFNPLYGVKRVAADKVSSDFFDIEVDSDFYMQNRKIPKMYDTRQFNPSLPIDRKAGLMLDEMHRRQVLVMLEILALKKALQATQKRAKQFTKNENEEGITACMEANNNIDEKIKQLESELKSVMTLNVEFAKEIDKVRKNKKDPKGSEKLDAVLRRYNDELPDSQKNKNRDYFDFKDIKNQRFLKGLSLLFDSVDSDKGKIEAAREKLTEASTASLLSASVVPVNPAMPPMPARSPSSSSTTQDTMNPAPKKTELKKFSDLDFIYDELVESNIASPKGKATFNPIHGIDKDGKINKEIPPQFDTRGFNPKDPFGAKVGAMLDTMHRRETLIKIEIAVLNIAMQNMKTQVTSFSNPGQRTAGLAKIDAIQPDIEAKVKALNNELQDVQETHKTMTDAISKSIKNDARNPDQLDTMWETYQAVYAASNPETRAPLDLQAIDKKHSDSKTNGANKSFDLGMHQYIEKERSMITSIRVDFNKVMSGPLAVTAGASPAVSMPEMKRDKGQSTDSLASSVLGVSQPKIMGQFESGRSNPSSIFIDDRDKNSNPALTMPSKKNRGKFF